MHEILKVYTFNYCTVYNCIVLFLTLYNFLNCFDKEMHHFIGGLWFNVGLEFHELHFISLYNIGNRFI